MSRGSHEPPAISCHNIYGDSVDSRDIGKIVSTVRDPTLTVEEPVSNGSYGQCQAVISRITRPGVSTSVTGQ